MTKIFMPHGTFVDMGSLRKGQRATMVQASGRIIQTSPVMRYVQAGGYVEIETKNSIYIIGGHDAAEE